MDIDFAKWKEQLGPDWIILFKPHYLLKTGRIHTDSSLVRIIPEQTDTNSLLLCADALVTDYSSIMFDYALLSRPLYLYRPDKSTYVVVTRGFYFDIEQNMADSIYESPEAMIHDIREGRWSQKTLDFINTTFNPNEDGHNAARLVEAVFTKL